MTSSPHSRSRSATNKESIQARLDLDDLSEFANEPGPGHYFGPDNHGFSSLGDQKLSKCKSAPSTRFRGMTGWDEWSRVVISRGHEQAFMGRDSPGAVYSPKEYSIGSDKGTAWAASRANRPDLSLSLGMNPTGSPGPKYNVRSTIHHHHRSSKSGKAAKPESFSKASRFAAPSKRIALGPGQYEHSMRPFQINTDSGRSFGVHRSAYDKVVRPGWELEGQGKESIGVGPPLSNDSRVGYGSAYSIGRQERFPTNRETSKSPGPGAYTVNQKSLGALKSICSDTPSPSVTKFGKLPKKPRFRQMLAINCSKHGGWGYF